MHRILVEERGFDIHEREVMRTRTKLGMMLRQPNGAKEGFVSNGKRAYEEIDNDDDATGVDYGNLNEGDLDDDIINHLTSSQFTETAELEKSSRDSKSANKASNPLIVSRIRSSGMAGKPRAPTPELSEEVIAKRHERMLKKQAESDELWRTKKRRRRTRDRAGLPADPPCPPRFPSETTIDEAKKFLHLNDKTYQEMRRNFTNICNELSIIKKTLAGPDGWKAAMDRLILESPHLTRYCNDMPSPGRKERLAVDIICSDVTKRIRVQGNKMTIADAKNALGVNPEESRQIRSAYYDILKADHFTSKLEAGDEHWDELKQKWIDGLPILQDILAPGDADPQHSLKVKAIEVLCRDVMKRLRDDQAKHDPNRKKMQVEKSSANKPANESENASNQASHGYTPAITHLASEALANSSNLVPTSMAQNPFMDHAHLGLPNMSQDAYGDFDLDPELFNTALDGNLTQAPEDDHRLTPVFFRLSPSSPIQVEPKIWLDPISSVTIKNIETSALSKHPIPAAMRVSKIEGILRTAPHDLECPCHLGNDGEVKAYMEYLNGGKVVLEISLAPL